MGRSESRVIISNRRDAAAGYVSRLEDALGAQAVLVLLPLVAVGPVSHRCRSAPRECAREIYRTSGLALASTAHVEC